MMLNNEFFDHLQLKPLLIGALVFSSFQVLAESSKRIPIADTFFSSTYTKIGDYSGPKSLNNSMFTLNSAQSFKRIVINFYSSNTCGEEPISEIYVADENGKPEFLVPEGYWVINNSSAFGLCSLYSDFSGGGCDVEHRDINSIQVKYVYSDGKSYLGQCYSGVDNSGEFLTAQYGAKICTSNDCALIHDYSPDQVPSH